jgi:hypothetical protein
LSYLGEIMRIQNLALVSTLLVACSILPSNERSGTERMGARLREIAHNQDLTTNTYLNARRVGYLRSLDAPLDPLAKLRSSVLLARELLRAGSTGEAIDELLRVQPEFEARKVQMNPTLDMLLGIAYMRLGEQENCLNEHNTESCLLPLSGAGIHTKKQGSRAAVSKFTAILERDPSDLTARWLLNIAYMTLGEYPDAVPDSWLVMPEIFESEYNLGRFIDIAPKLGLDLVSLAGGCVMDDFDGDGNLDLLISSWGLDQQLRYFRNNGNGGFDERTQEAGLEGITGGLHLIHADYDNNGYLDCLALRGAWQGKDGRHPNSLLRNSGNASFTDVTEAAGLFSMHPTQTAAWGDYDGDGWLDLFIGNESFRGEIHPCELFHSNGDGTFTERASEVGVAVEGFVKGISWGDSDNDGDLDLYVSRLQGDNFLFRNDGAGTEGRWNFADIASAAGVTEPQESFPTWFWDYDNDGWLDLFVSGYHYNPDINAGDVAADYLGLPTNAERARLFRNNGDGTFADLSKETRIHKVLYTMGCNYGDLDNDGFLDFYVATGSPSLRAVMPNRMFRNAEGRFFQDVTTSGGFGHLQKGHGVAVGDLDNDGDQDFYAVMGGAYTGDVSQNVLFENPGHGNRWVSLELEGVRSNRSAIGTRIAIEVETGAGQRTVYATVASGSSFGALSMRQEIGLGQATAIRSISITWPTTSTVQVFENVPLDRAFRVREGEEALIPLTRQRLMLNVAGRQVHDHH